MNLLPTLGLFFLLLASVTASELEDVVKLEESSLNELTASKLHIHSTSNESTIATSMSHSIPPAINTTSGAIIANNLATASELQDSAVLMGHAITQETPRQHPISPERRDYSKAFFEVPDLSGFHMLTIARLQLDTDWLLENYKLLQDSFSETIPKLSEGYELASQIITYTDKYQSNTLRKANEVYQKLTKGTERALFLSELQRSDGQRAIAQRNTEKLIAAAEDVISLTGSKIRLLISADIAESSGRIDTAKQFRDIAKITHAARLNMLHFAQNAANEKTEDALAYYEGGLSLQHQVDQRIYNLIKTEGLWLKTECRELFNQAVLASDTTRIANLSKAITCIKLCEENNILPASSSSMKPAFISAQYYMQAAQAYAIGTEKSLKQAKSFENAAKATLNANDMLSYASLFQTQWCNRAGQYYMQAAQAYAIGTEEGLTQAENFENAADITKELVRLVSQKEASQNLWNEEQTQWHNRTIRYYTQVIPLLIKKAEENRQQVSAIIINTSLAKIALAILSSQQEKSNSTSETKNEISIEQQCTNLCLRMIDSIDSKISKNIPVLDINEEKTQDKMSLCQNLLAQGMEQLEEDNPGPEEKEAIIQALFYALQLLQTHLEKGSNDSLHTHLLIKSLENAAETTFQAAEFYNQATIAQSESNDTESRSLIGQARYCQAKANIYATKGKEAGDLFTEEEYLDKLDTSYFKDIESETEEEEN